MTLGHDFGPFVWLSPMFFRSAFKVVYPKAAAVFALSPIYRHRLAWLTNFRSDFMTMSPFFIALSSSVHRLSLSCDGTKPRYLSVADSHVLCLFFDFFVSLVSTHAIFVCRETRQHQIEQGVTEHKSHFLDIFGFLASRKGNALWYWS